MVKFIRKTVSFSALWVSEHDRLSDFYLSSWQRGESPLPMIVVRVLLSLFALSIFTWSLVEGGSTPHWLIYLTNWGIMVVVSTMLSSLAVSSVFLSKKQLETTELPWFVRLYWVVFNITVTLSVMITALYWILLYDPANRKNMGRAFYLDIFTHGMTSCIVVAELLISRTPVRLTHIYQPLGLGLCYAAFTAIYYAAGGTDRLGNVFIYSVLNWEQPKRTGIVVAGSVAALIVLYLVLWSLAFFRDKLSLTYVRAKSLDLALTPPRETVDPKIV